MGKHEDERSISLKNTILHTLGTHKVVSAKYEREIRQLDNGELTSGGLRMVVDVVRLEPIVVVVQNDRLNHNVDDEL